MKHKQADIAIFTRRLSDLLEGGLPLTKCLAALSEQTEDPGLRSTVRNLTDMVSNGKSLSRAFLESGGHFSPVMVEMIRVGEESGSLETVFRHLSEFLESEIDARRKIRDAMTYPVLLIGLSILVGVFIVGFVLPRFESLFAELGADLPLPTKMLMTVVSWISHPSLPLFAVGIFIAGIPLIEKHAGPKGPFHPLLHRIAPIRRWIRAFYLQKWFHVMEILLKSGFPLFEAIRLSRGVIADSWFEGHLTALQQKIFEGQPLAKAMSASPAFPVYICELIATGEETAGLESVFGRLFRTYERESRLSLRRFLSLLEPGLMVLMGGFVGFIALAMLLPIFEMSASLK